MVYPFNGSDLGRLVDRRDSHAVLVGNVLHIGREAIAARRALDRLQCPVVRGKLRAWGKSTVIVLSWREQAKSEITAVPLSPYSA